MRAHRSFSEGALPLGNALTAFTSACSWTRVHSAGSAFASPFVSCFCPVSCSAASPVSLISTSENDSSRLVRADSISRCLLLACLVLSLRNVSNALPWGLASTPSTVNLALDILITSSELRVPRYAAMASQRFLYPLGNFFRPFPSNRTSSSVQSAPTSSTGFFSSTGFLALAGGGVLGTRGGLLGSGSACPATPRHAPSPHCARAALHSSSTVSAGGGGSAASASHSSRSACNSSPEHKSSVWSGEGSNDPASSLCLSSSTAVRNRARSLRTSFFSFSRSFFSSAFAAFANASSAANRSASAFAAASSSILFLFRSSNLACFFASFSAFSAAFMAIMRGSIRYAVSI
mmetsp:Transcript_11285/g.21372  ORF Transcript_11285/g.21372 Transcript_11285/m.21372 type:complete len:348 (-) Transcript_11285:946-1989(-)